MFLGTNSARVANWKYQESQGAQISVSQGQEQKSQILTWCMLTKALKSVDLSSDLWFIQCNPVITVGKHRWLSLLPGATTSKLIKEQNDKAGF